MTTSEQALRQRTRDRMAALGIPEGTDDPTLRALGAAPLHALDFRWCWPKFNRYTPADKRVRVAINRYPHNVIGIAVVAFGRCWGVQWKASR